VRLDDELAADAEAIARADGTSLNETVKQALKEEAKRESLGLEPFNLYQVAIRDLTALTGLNYGPLAQADTMPAAPERIDTPAVRAVERRSDITAE